MLPQSRSSERPRPSMTTEPHAVYGERVPSGIPTWHHDACQVGFQCRALAMLSNVYGQERGRGAVISK